MPESATSVAEFTDQTLSVESPAPPVPRVIRRIAEVILFALVTIAPWLFACVEPAFEFLLAAGIVMLLALWVLHAALARRVAFRLDVVTIGLAGLVLWTALQLVPLPAGLVGFVSPQRLTWHTELLPTVAEVLPGESGPGTPRSAWLPLTVAPAQSRLFLARVLGLFLVYLVVRNWLATRDSLKRFAWVMTVNGTLLAVLSLAAFFSSPRDRVLWKFPVVADSVYGPFVCRNHYPDYLAVCLGLAAGLMFTPAGDDRQRVRRRANSTDDGWMTPRTLGLGAAVALMAVSVPFSLSRGGTLAVLAGGAVVWVLTRWRDEALDAPEESVTSSRYLLPAAVAGAALLMLWLGTGAVESRLGTLASETALSSRWPLWRDSARLIPSVWSFGTGAGTFGSAEPTVRAINPVTGQYTFENAHNEFLEAIVEGGIVRLGLTVLLAVGVVVAAGRGYLRRRGRTVAPLLLGLTFAMAVIAWHASGDFALHMPAVGLTAAVAAAFVLAGGTDTSFAPTRLKVRKVRAGDATVTEVIGPTGPPPVSEPLWVKGSAALLLVSGFTIASGFVAWEIRRQSQAENLKVLAEAAFWQAFPRVTGLPLRAELYAERARLLPDDAGVQYDAGQAHLDAAVAQTWMSAGAMVGGALAFAEPPTRFTPSAVQAHATPSAAFFRQARAADPLLAKAHGRLSVVAPYLTSAEPPEVHLTRAKRLAPGDAEAWFAAGREAWTRGATNQAIADWHHSLRLSLNHLPTILKLTRGSLSPDQIQTELLPADPVVLVAAADILFPKSGEQAVDRQPYLERAVAADRAGPTSLVAAARAYADLGRTDEANGAFLAALLAAPNRFDIRDRYAHFLVADERYTEALEQLEWLRRKASPGAFQDRYDAARRGRELMRAITNE